MIYRFLIIVFSLSLANCYVYKPMEKPSEITKNDISDKEEGKKAKKKKKKEKPILLTKDEAIQSLKKDAYYKVNDVNHKSYKIRYKKTDRDSIYGHKKNCEDKPVAIARKDIETIKDRRFSKLNSDLITFPILGGLAAGLLILVL
ncbi:hypothetical protein UJ101_02727 [Flavobacteriaceae bacterium UJ101]|nr:hypothetical protein UJ101_02727 [Flavobacteriaceae bacterium UJ101]